MNPAFVCLDPTSHILLKQKKIWIRPSGFQIQKWEQSCFANGVYSLFLLSGGIGMGYFYIF